MDEGKIWIKLIFLPGDLLYREDRNLLNLCIPQSTNDQWMNDLTDERVKIVGTWKNQIYSPCWMGLLISLQRRKIEDGSKTITMTNKNEK